MKLLRLISFAGSLAIVFCLPSAEAWAGKHATAATVTGCLMKGTQPNEYTMTANGTTYDVHPQGGLNMADGAGHKVEVTGKLARPKHGGAKAASRTAGERIDVTSFKVLGSACG